MVMVASAARLASGDLLWSRTCPHPHELFVLPGDIFVTLLRYSAAGYAARASDGSLAELLLEQMLFRTGRRPSPSEVLSWERSLPVLADDLVEAGLTNVEVLLEYHSAADLAAG